MVEKIWYDNHWMGKISAPILWPLSLVFGRVANHRYQRFMANQENAYHPNVPVVVVGNLTAGGNGKTPVVIWLVEKLLSMGMKPGVVSRGYGGKAKRYPLVLDAETLPTEAGDEPVLIHQRTGVPVAVSPKRPDAVKALLPLGVDIIISDDGLQHYALARDVEIVVVDDVRQFGNQHYLPFGPLRENVSRLNQVDFVIYNQTESTPNPNRIESTTAYLNMQLMPTHLVNLQTNEKLAIDFIDEDISRNSVAIAGIGNPHRFFETLGSLDIKPTQCHAFADHYDFNYQKLLGLASKEQNLLMTEKDAVKCRALLAQNQDTESASKWWYLPVDADFSHQVPYMVFKKIEQIREAYGS